MTLPTADVSDVLRDRQQDADGLRQATLVSVLAHALLLVGMVVAPTAWMSGEEPEPQAVMTISLGGGTPGPANGGMTPIPGRAVQAEPLPEPPPRPEPVRPPAEATPEMVEPKSQVRPPVKAAPQPPVTTAPDEARGKTPTRGPEPSPGSALAETGARGQGFGLSTGGGSGSGSRLDVADFCCPEYLVLMIERIRSNWNARADAIGETMVKFSIARDGQIQGVEVEKSSGYAALDINAQRALLLTRQLPALPVGFTNPTLTVHLNFQYTR